MNIKKLQDADIENKKVLLRVDFNVSIEDQTVKERTKIKACEDTLRYLLAMNAKVALITHLGRPDGKNNSAYSLDPIKDDIEYILGYKVHFVSACTGAMVKEAVDKLEENEIVLLENVRFHEEEENNDETFAQNLAENFDIYINDAFSVSHRDQASVTAVTKFLPSYAGLGLQKEIEEMDKMKETFEHPAIAIIGGAKIETKLPVIKFFEEKYDYVLLGGKVANEALDQKLEFGKNVYFPRDFAEYRQDLGPETIAQYKELIATAKTIVWNGPTGKFEDDRFAISSNELLKAILESSAHVVIGGGETLEILEKNKAVADIEKRGYISTGGGAMLDYLGGTPLPGIVALEISA